MENLIDLKYDLQPYQVTQIQMDFKQEKVLRELLLIFTNIVINYDIYTIWEQIINDWHNMIIKYSQQQLLSHQMLYAESYQEDDDDDDDTEYFEYEPVFDENDSRRYSHGHEQKQRIDQSLTTNSNLM